MTRIDTLGRAFAALLSTTLAAQTTPPCGGSLSLLGNAAYVTVADAPLLQNADRITYEAWFLATGYKGRILSKGDGLSSTSNRSFDLTYDPTGFVTAEFFLTTGSTRPYISVASTTPVPLNKWTHVAATFDTTNAEVVLFVNGTQVAKAATPAGAKIYQCTTPLYIGGTPPHTIWFSGQIKVARIYAVALTLPLVQAFMATDSSALPNLSASWPLAGHLFDLKGGYDGTAVGPIAYVGGCATWANYGAGTAGPYGVPSWTLDARPALGTTVNFRADNPGVATAQALFLLGVQPLAVAALGGTLLVNPIVVSPLSIPNGGAALPIAIPNNVSLHGVPLFSQLPVLFPSASLPAFSRGLQLMLGS